MRPFQEFRFWARRAPLSERVSASVAMVLVLGLIAWLAVPDRDDTTGVKAVGSRAGITRGVP